MEKKGASLFKLSKCICCCSSQKRYVVLFGAILVLGFLVCIGAYGGFLEPTERIFSLMKGLDEYHGNSMEELVANKIETEVIRLRMAVANGAINNTYMSTYAMDEHMESFEWDVLSRPALMDAMAAGNGTTSTLTIIDPDLYFTYRVGDVIKVRVDVRDGYGRLTNQGGDQVRVWISDPDNRTSLAPEVTDLGNGSHVADIPLAWDGTVSIRASVEFNVAIQRAHYFIRNSGKTTRYIAGAFKTDFGCEVTLCLPFPIIPGSSEVCNFTSKNGGLPWYCGKPKTPGLQCHDWKYNCDLHFSLPLQLTAAEEVWSDAIRNLTHQRLPETTIQVVPGITTSHLSPKPRCGSLPVGDSWTSKAPRGFFRKFKWNPFKCSFPVLSVDETVDCLRDTTFLLLGDSNMRRAFNILVDRTECDIEEPQATANWHKPLSCFSRAANASVFWKPHGLPFHLGSDLYADRHNVKHPSAIIDEVPSQGRFVILIHTYFHITPYHYSVFKTIIRSIRRSVENLMQRNPQVKVIFRGPHTACYNVPWQSVAGGDLAGLHYTDIIKREFKGLYDKVLLLLPWDMTLSIENYSFHPPAYVDHTMMNLVLDYVCWNRHQERLIKMAPNIYNRTKDIKTMR